MQLADKFIEHLSLTFPVVLKPNAGERGTNVFIVKDRTELEQRLNSSDEDIILQEFVAGEEFGLFYYRYPNEKTGRIFAITEKVFPKVIGDGTSSLHDLILADDWAICMADIFRVMSFTSTG